MLNESGEKKTNHFLKTECFKVLKIAFQTFCDYKEKLFHSTKNRILPKGLTHAFGQKYHLFLYLFSVTMRLEIMLNKVWDRKETFFDYKNKIFQRLNNGIFPKGLTHAFGQKMHFFLSFVFAKNKTSSKG